MNTVIKSTLRNIKSKFGRSIVLILCVMLTSIVAILAVSGRTTIENTVTGIMRAMTGSVDFTIDTSSEHAFDNCPEADISGYAVTSVLHSKRDAEHYYLSYSDKIGVYNFSDFHSIYEMNQIGTDIEITGDEVYVSEKYAEKYDVKVGDTITLYGSSTSVSVDVVIKGIAKIPDAAPIQQRSIMVSKDIYCALTNSTSVNYIFYFVDVKDDSEIKAFEEQVKKNDYKAEIESLVDAELDGIDTVTQIFMFLFLFTFLLVIFVTINFSEKIVNERMSLIGTLRSLGVSRRKTSLILILENAFYGLVGSVLGSIVFAWGMPILFDSIATFDVGEGYGQVNIMDYYDSASIWVYVVVVIGAILVECLCPLFSLVKAVRTPIRDIIFQNKDTNFKYSWNRFYLGMLLIIVSLVCSLLRKSFVALCICLTTTVIALAVLTPFILKGITILSEKFISSEKTPLLKLSLKEVSNNKHMVATSVLCVTTLILSTCLNTFSVSFLNDLSDLKDDYDVVIQNPTQKDQYYSFIESLPGVTGVERFKADEYLDCKVGSIEKPFTVICDTDLDSRYDTAELDGNLGYHEIAITNKLANKLDVKVGDTIDVTIGTDYTFPCAYQATVAKIINNYGYTTNAIVVSTDIYDQISNGDSTYGLINISCEEGQADYVRSQLLKYLTDSETDIKTRAMSIRELRESNRNAATILYGIMGMGVVLTLIGTSGNQIIAFESRRREIAVLYSTAMNKKQLRKLLVLETALSVGIGVVISIVLGGFISRLFCDAMNIVTEGDMPDITYSITSQLKYVFIVYLILMLTTLSPIRRLRKMKPAQELKYE